MPSRSRCAASSAFLAAFLVGCAGAGAIPPLPGEANEQPAAPAAPAAGPIDEPTRGARRPALPGAAPASIELTDVLARASSPLGVTVEVVVEADGSPQVFVGGRRVTQGDAVRFDPAVDRLGHFAFAESPQQVTRSRLVVDGEIVLDDGALVSHLAYAGEVLHFVRADLTTDRYQHCRRSPGAMPDCAELTFVPAGLLEDSGTVFLDGFEPETGRWVIRRVDGTASLEVASDGPAMLARKDGRVVVLQPRGDQALLRLFFAYARFAGVQLGEPFAAGGDALGRLAWNESYRVRAASELARISRDPRLAAYARNAAAALGARLDSEGLVTSTKYSLDGVTPIHLAVNHGMIHHALLEAVDPLDEPARGLTVRRAVRMMDTFEADWASAYRQTQCIEKEYDGIVLPFNQQSALGLVALDLLRLTGDARWRLRAEALYTNLVRELELSNGLAIWHYWPASFLAGWTAGSAISCHSPSQSPRRDPFYSDTDHAAIDAEFMLAAAATFGVSAPIDVDGIAARVELAPRSFSRFVSGDTSRYPATWRYLPPLWFGRSSPGAYGSLVVQPYADWDEQPRLLSHALAARSSLPTPEARVEIVISTLERDRLRVVESRMLAEGDLLDLWLSLGHEAKGLGPAGSR